MTIRTSRSKPTPVSHVRVAGSDGMTLKGGDSTLTDRQEARFAGVSNRDELGEPKIRGRSQTPDLTAIRGDSAGRGNAQQSRLASVTVTNLPISDRCPRALPGTQRRPVMLKP